MTALIPRTILFGNPRRSTPKLSPGGGQIAYLAPLADVMNVWVQPVEGGEARPITQDDDRGIHHYSWAHNGRHLLYIQDQGGDENWCLYAVDQATAEVRALTPFEGVQVQIVGHSRRYPDLVVIAMNRRDPRVHDLYRLDLNSGELELAAENPGTVAHWLVDQELQVRGIVTARPDGGYDLGYRSTEEDPWETIVSWDFADSTTSAPICFTGDGRKLCMTDSRDANTARVVLLDPERGQLEVLAEDPHYDAGNILVHPVHLHVEAVSFVREREEWTVLDEAVAADFAVLQELHPGDFAVVSRDHADDTWIVRYKVDTGSTEYFVYERSERTSRHLFSVRPELNQYPLQPMEPITYTARDGLTIHGYLTRAVTAEEPGPMVLAVHGGPWGRDTWGYDSTAQWLANRGYHCLQVNFRGSTGYGKEFVNAGDREWAGAMHDDLIDAVAWAVEEGIADPGRVAIYGGSYGGYAALVGATFTPDVFRCAVDIVGPSNLVTLLNSVPPYWSTVVANLKRRVGDPERDEAFLKERSPLFKVDKIQIPILIAQGANDPRVKQAESEQIVAAMEEKGLDYEYLVFEDEGHGFAKPENRLTFFAHAERFLAQHLGGRYEP